MSQKLYLRPCPFCGKTPERFDMTVVSDSVTRLQIDCVCGINYTIVPAFRYLDTGEALDAIEIWNFRSPKKDNVC